MKKLIVPLAVLALAGLLQVLDVQHPDMPGAAQQAPAVPAVSNARLLRAIEARAEDVQIEAWGEVAKILPDDNKGSRHQRFIVRLPDGQTVLIAHNIDLAPRVAPLDTGDIVMFSGEYVWNPQGGVVHWTHHDPQGRHLDGWIRRAGRIFQ